MYVLLSYYVICIFLKAIYKFMTYASTYMWQVTGLCDIIKFIVGHMLPFSYLSPSVEGMPKGTCISTSNS